MSNALAIAAVTAVLKDLLQDGLIDHEATAGMNVTVSVLPPDHVFDGLDAGDTQLNLFLYQVSPNQGWRNVGQPARDSRGERAGSPPLALDLHYLLTAYSDQDFHTEILLGYAMQLLHETPALGRDAIRTALAPASPVPGDVLPSPQNVLSAADLADQVEMIKITPRPMSMEDMAHIWSNIGSRYRPTVAYDASVVLIEGRRPARSAPAVRKANIYARTFRQPRIDQLGSQATPTSPTSTTQAILPGYRLVLLGQQLRGEDIRARIGEFELMVALADASDTRIAVVLPAGLRAGVQAAQIVHRVPMGTPPTPHRGVESNVAAFVLRPALTGAPTFVPAAGDTPQGVRLGLNPPVGKKQRVTLLLDELQPAPPAVPDPPPTPPARAYSFALPPRDGDAADSDATLTIPAPGAAAGTYLVRVQVDGAESVLATDSNGRYNGPTVEIV